MDKQLKTIQTHGISSLNNFTENTLSKLLLRANEAYYNDDEVIPDSIYDILKEYIETRFPNNMAIKMVGAPVKKKRPNYHMKCGLWIKSKQILEQWIAGKKSIPETK